MSIVRGCVIHVYHVQCVCLRSFLCYTTCIHVHSDICAYRLHQISTTWKVHVNDCTVRMYNPNKGLGFCIPKLHVHSTVPEEYCNSNKTVRQPHLNRVTYNIEQYFRECFLLSTVYRCWSISTTQSSMHLLQILRFHYQCCKAFRN